MDTESFNLFRLVPGEWLERGTNFHTIDDSHARNKSVQYIEFRPQNFSKIFIRGDDLRNVETSLERRGKREKEDVRR